jgi:HTH domain
MNTPVHSSPPHQRRHNTGNSIVRVLETTAPKLRRAAQLALHNSTRRSVLKLLVTHDNGVTYQTLFDALPVSERWVRQIVADLRSEGIVKTPGNPALIQFTTRRVSIAIKELVAFLSSEWVAVVTDEHEGKTALSADIVCGSSSKHLDHYLKTMVKLIRGERG